MTMPRLVRNAIVRPGSLGHARSLTSVICGGALIVPCVDRCPQASYNSSDHTLLQPLGCTFTSFSRPGPSATNGGITRCYPLRWRRYYNRPDIRYQQEP